MNKIIFVLVLLVFSISWAQDNADDSKKEPSKIQMSFDDELVQGGTIKPDLNYLTSRGKLNYKKLIRLRESFVPEAQRGRGEFNDK